MNDAATAPAMASKTYVTAEKKIVQVGESMWKAKKQDRKEECHHPQAIKAIKAIHY